MILSLGEALIDFIPRTGPDGKSSYLPVPGGSPYNTSIALARLGVPVTFVGKLSRDFFGDMLLDNLAANGVDTSRIRRVDRPTTLAFVKIEPGNDNRYAFYARGAADAQLLPEDLPDPLPGDARMLHFGSISLLAEPFASTMDELLDRAGGRLLVSIDPNIRESMIADPDRYRQALSRHISRAAVVKASDVDLQWLFGTDSVEEGAMRLLELGPALAVVTRGEHGSIGITRSGRAEEPAERVRMVDTVGAGDTFHAGLLAWLYREGFTAREEVEALAGARLSSALQFASRAAALTCTREGADPPTLAELQAYRPSGA